MTIYRILRDADAGKHGRFKPGDRTRLEWLDEDQIQLVVRRGVARPEASPKLAELKGWTTRARRLKNTLDIETVEAFLDADPTDVAGGLNVKLETVNRWKKEINDWFEAPPAKRG
jgi:hypothetical protein